MGIRLETLAGESTTTKLHGDDIPGLVTRLVKWSVAEHGLPPATFPIHSLRAGGATCLYHSGADSEYISRFGRLRSAKFAIYLHFEDSTLRILLTFLVNCD